MDIRALRPLLPRVVAALEGRSSGSRIVRLGTPSQPSRASGSLIECANRPRSQRRARAGFSPASRRLVPSSCPSRSPSRCLSRRPSRVVKRQWVRILPALSRRARSSNRSRPERDTLHRRWSHPVSPALSDVQESPHFHAGYAGKCSVRSCIAIRTDSRMLNHFGRLPITTQMARSLRFPH